MRTPVDPVSRPALSSNRRRVLSSGDSGILCARQDPPRYPTTSGCGLDRSKIQSVACFLPCRYVPMVFPTGCGATTGAACHAQRISLSSLMQAADMLLEMNRTITAEAVRVTLKTFRWGTLRTRRSVTHVSACPKSTVPKPPFNVARLLFRASLTSTPFSNVVLYLDDD